MNVQSPLSLHGILRRSPAPDSQQALKALQTAGANLVQGQPAGLPDAPQLLDAAVGADGLCDVSRSLLRSFRAEGLALDEISSLLRSAGLQEVMQGKVSANYEHHFDMHYGPGGGFRGSNSYDTAGETPLARFKAYQKPGAQLSDPALVRVDYTRPGFVGPSLSGTTFDGRSSSRSLFFTSDLSQVQGLAGDTLDGDEACKQRLELALKSLDAASGLQLHDFTTGYGRVGTSYHHQVRAGGKNLESDAVTAGAAGLHGMRRVLGVSGAQVPAGPAEVAPSSGTRALMSLALGAGAAGIGGMLPAMGPVVGSVLAGLGVAGLGALGYAAHRQDSRDFALPTPQAQLERDRARATRGLQNGMLMGAALAGSAALGSTLGWQGAVVAGLGCAAAEGVLAWLSPAGPAAGS